jgi:hypothetical protein
MAYSKISRGPMRKDKMSVIRWEIYRMRGHQLILLRGLDISIILTFLL